LSAVCAVGLRSPSDILKNSLGWILLPWVGMVSVVVALSRGLARVFVLLVQINRSFKK
jgi:hypothetical protein